MFEKLDWTLNQIPGFWYSFYTNRHSFAAQFFDTTGNLTKLKLLLGY